MKRIVLCNEKLSRVAIHVSASFDDGKLVIHEQDLGNAPHEVWGKDEHEAFYTLDKTDTQKLLSLLGDDGSHSLETIKAHFNGIDCCKRFGAFCDMHGISYRQYVL